MRARALVLVTLGYALLLELQLVAAMVFWPEFQKNILSLRVMAAPLPALQEMFDQIAEGGVVPYVTGQHLFKSANTLGTLAAVLFAVGAVAAEAHRGTMEILLARPRSRLRTLSERWIGGLLAVTIPLFLTTATLPWMRHWAGEDLDLYPLMLCALHESIFLSAIFGLTFLLSAVGSNPIKIALWVLFLSTFCFAIYFVKMVTHWSLYRLADVEDFLRINDTLELDWRVCGPLLAFTVLSFALSAIAFRRRVP